MSPDQKNNLNTEKNEEKKKQEAERIRERKLEERNFTKFGLNSNPVVSLASGLFILIFSGYALLNLEKANQMLQWINESIVNHFDWLFYHGK